MGHPMALVGDVMNEYGSISNILTCTHSNHIPHLYTLFYYMSYRCSWLPRLFTFALSHVQSNLHHCVRTCVNTLLNLHSPWSTWNTPISWLTIWFISWLYGGWWYNIMSNTYMPTISLNTTHNLHGCASNHETVNIGQEYRRQLHYCNSDIVLHGPVFTYDKLCGIA